MISGARVWYYARHDTQNKVPHMQHYRALAFAFLLGVCLGAAIGSARIVRSDPRLTTPPLRAYNTCAG